VIDADREAWLDSVSVETAGDAVRCVVKDEVEGMVGVTKRVAVFSGVGLLS
jgi:hypothetical protein